MSASRADQTGQSSIRISAEIGSNFSAHQQAIGVANQYSLAVTGSLLILLKLGRNNGLRYLDFLICHPIEMTATFGFR